MHGHLLAGEDHQEHQTQKTNSTTQSPGRYGMIMMMIDRLTSRLLKKSATLVRGGSQNVATPNGCSSSPSPVLVSQTGGFAPVSVGALANNSGPRYVAMDTF